MPLVQVALEEGFEGDTVEIRVAGGTVVRDDVRTRTVVGLAELVDVPVRPGSWPLEVELPQRHLITRLLVEVGADDVHVRVQAHGDRLDAEVVDGHHYA